LRTSTVIGLILIVGFAALGAVAFRKTVTPYVSVPEAKASQDIVQVYGAIDQAHLKYDRQTAEITFPLTDLKNNTMVVRYRGVRPGNMAQATHCVATGQWRGDHFEATTLLIKCPSKYQGEKKA
jgi:cytochrome c-type biogenesis protein CcmE